MPVAYDDRVGLRPVASPTRRSRRRGAAPGTDPAWATWGDVSMPAISR